jgi:hypothetical protein
MPFVIVAIAHLDYRIASAGAMIAVCANARFSLAEV